MDLPFSDQLADLDSAGNHWSIVVGTFGPVVDALDPSTYHRDAEGIDLVEGAWGMIDKVQDPFFLARETLVMQLTG